ncbi:hypothetical protein THAOC_26328 [Thalassiosira oceanica]|uniref:Uncharacterized protein n=1 Tax=Thalassiosira oceanica TaxID=159749 RepID=K0RK62_THAOC|nr:hypothetical protein THAOC_26328 [Thalassiosira oceanica]|eukprot:EJK54113.1 hypothetical protein THAOC_26328 [Thalassiosira oceanica]
MEAGGWAGENSVRSFGPNAICSGAYPICYAPEQIGFAPEQMALRTCPSQRHLFGRTGAKHARLMPRDLEDPIRRLDSRISQSHFSPCPVIQSRGNQVFLFLKPRRPGLLFETNPAVMNSILFLQAPPSPISTRDSQVRTVWTTCQACIGAQRHFYGRNAGL